MKTIGIIGGGQLGLMIIEQAHLLGARTVCLDPAADAPAFALSDERIVGRFDDPAALEELCRRSDVVTYEFENVPGNLLVALEQKYNIKQGFRPLFDSQDRLREKSNACDHGLKTPAFMAVDDEESLHRAIARIGYPCVLKTRTLGYDGHGQAVLRGEADLAKARELLAVPCILEEFVPFDFEASVVLVSDGERVICFPVGRNIHKDGILDLCIVPAEMPDQVEEEVKKHRAELILQDQYGIVEANNRARIGQIYRAVVEDYDAYTDSYTGRTWMDAPEIDGTVRFTCGYALEDGDFVDVEVFDVSDYDLIGEVV